MDIQATAEPACLIAERCGCRVRANESTFDRSAPPELLALFAEHPAVYGTFTPDTLRDLFEDAGLEVIWMTAVCRGEEATL